MRSTPASTCLAHVFGSEDIASLLLALFDPTDLAVLLCVASTLAKEVRIAQTEMVCRHVQALHNLLRAEAARCRCSTEMALPPPLEIETVHAALYWRCELHLPQLGDTRSWERSGFMHERPLCSSIRHVGNTLFSSVPRSTTKLCVNVEAVLLFHALPCWRTMPKLVELELVSPPYVVFANEQCDVLLKWQTLLQPSRRLQHIVLDRWLGARSKQNHSLLQERSNFQYQQITHRLNFDMDLRGCPRWPKTAVQDMCDTLGKTLLYVFDMSTERQRHLSVAEHECLTRNLEVQQRHIDALYDRCCLAGLFALVHALRGRPRCKHSGDCVNGDFTLSMLQAEIQQWSWGNHDLLHGHRLTSQLDVYLRILKNSRCTASVFESTLLELDHYLRKHIAVHSPTILLRTRSAQSVDIESVESLVASDRPRLPRF